MKRRKFMQVRPGELRGILRGMDYVSCEGLPEDAVLVSIQYTGEADQILLLWEHKSFEPVGEGELFPELELERD